MLVTERAMRLKSTVRDFDPVLGWEPLTHPEGALFFYHSNHVRLQSTHRSVALLISHQRVFTYANVRDYETTVKMDDVAKKAYREARIVNAFLDRSSVELVLEGMKGEDSKWGYYFADHDKRVIFWLKPHKSKELMGNVQGVNSASHISECFLSNLHSELSHDVISRVCTRITILVRMAQSTYLPLPDRLQCADTLLQLCCLS
jgi:hypothetical protein